MSAFSSGLLSHPHEWVWLTVGQNAGETGQSRYKREHEMGFELQERVAGHIKEMNGWGREEGGTTAPVKGPGSSGMGGGDICTRVGLG